MTATMRLPSIAGLLLALFLAHAGPATAVATRVAEADLAPTATQKRATRLITHFIANYHYRKAELDDELSQRIFERYLESLDPSRSFLTAADLERFSRHATRMDDYLRTADLRAVYEIFKAYRARVSERVAFAAKLLEHEFDFQVDESFDVDRSEAQWPADGAALDELWRLRVKNDVLGLRIAGKDADEIRKTLGKRYEGLERRTLQIAADDVFQLFVNAYTTSIEPHTAYFSPRTSENFRIRMSLSLEGIGAVLQADDEYTLVRQVVPGGPAEKSGRLHPNDRIVGVGQGSEGDIVDVIGWRLDDVVDLIRGPKDSVVRLLVLPMGVGAVGPTRMIAISRNKIELEEQAAHSSVLELEHGARTLRIGVIEIPTFYLDFEARAAGDPDYRSTTRDVRNLLQALRAENVDGIVVDLRGNGGGSLTEATELTGLFIETGPVVQVRSADGRLQIERDTDPAIEYEGPLAVLVDRYSASASEIFAGAIQDYRRGVIVGEPTFGKGTVQNLVDLSRLDRLSDDGLGQLKATIAQFFRVAGASTQHRGVVPDIVLPTAEYAGHEGERSLDNALPWDQVKPARFVPAKAPLGPLAQARQRHEQRIAADEGFKVLVEEAQAVQEAKERSRVTLLEAQRRAERERARREQHDRENRLRAAVGLAPLPELALAEDGAETGADDALAEDEADAQQEREYDVVLTETAHILGDLVREPPALKSAERAGPALGAAAVSRAAACAGAGC